MAAPDRVHENRDRAESFGGVAEAYERYRPSYPDALVDDLVARAPRDALDVGCGTGKAARLLAARGVRVLGVEVDAQMAAVARRAGVAVEVARFEDWDARSRTFDLVVSGQAWHWIDPAIGVPKLAGLLRPHALLALFWNTVAVEEPLRTSLRALYRERAPHSRAEGRTFDDRSDPPYADDLRASYLFGPVETRHYKWQRSYTTREWVQLAQTHSDHLVMPADQRAGLMREVTAVVDAHGGQVMARYVTKAILATLLR
jgi:SAM-dependent methyltransferase